MDPPALMETFAEHIMLPGFSCDQFHTLIERVSAETLYQFVTSEAGFAQLVFVPLRNIFLQGIPQGSRSRLLWYVWVTWCLLQPYSRHNRAATRSGSRSRW